MEESTQMTCGHNTLDRKLEDELCYLESDLLMYGAELFLRNCQLCSHSGNSQQF
jgi:hypothetical protein